uniref:Uncharacterized protein n=1 Tax=Kwoniella pini CBS 10737 TaxID=1296096 RepID=A0A1B9HXT9_9TREE|nr:uncharacterized protein I206_05954 [Kwoniella pini CBS 10737]OCF48087.1 hypothetical protein I206_05954 [Kwoniella pini CBS 10737]
MSLSGEFSSPEKTPATKLPTLNIDEKAIPSENELRLGKRVLELEKERDELMTEINSLKAQRLPQHSTIPVPSKTDTVSDGPIEIHTSLIPVLAILRQHIAELTKDNQALRYTFLGSEKPNRGSIKTTQNPIIASPLPVPSTNTNVPISATSSKTTLDVDMVPSPTPAFSPNIAVPGPSNSAVSVSGSIPPTAIEVDRRNIQVDLEKVLDRVKTLIQENDELGEMILESGRKDDLQDQWEKTMEDSRNVISSLDSDLTHHLSVVQSLRSELSTYKSHFGPIPSGSSSSSSTLNAPSKHPISTSGQSTPTRSSHHSHQRERDRDRDRERDRDRDREKHREVSTTRNDRPHHDRDRVPPRRQDEQLSIRGASGQKKNDRDRPNQQGRISFDSSHRNGNGDSTGLKDDRAYKRRR